MSAKHEHELDDIDSSDLRRRDFVALSVAGAAAATALPAAAVPPGPAVAEKNVTIHGERYPPCIHLILLKRSIPEISGYLGHADV